MNKFLQIFRKVDGVRVLKQYARGHVLLYALAVTPLLGFSRKGLEQVRMAVEKKMLARLRRQYAAQLKAFRKKHPASPVREPSRIVWVCWFQGMDAAPEIVQRCYKRLREALPDREIRLLTSENYRQWSGIPEQIIAKYEAGIIGQAHFADLLRLDLLIRHGGTWIDATVLAAGRPAPDWMMDAPLFVFQMLKPGLDGHAVRMSNWFMSATPGNVILRLTQALLYDYWAHHDKLIDYFIFHLFFELAIETYPEEWSHVVPASPEAPHSLLLRLFEPYDQNVFEGILEQSPFHKLTYKFDEADTALEGTNYRHLMESLLQ